MFDLDFFHSDSLLIGTDEVGRGPIAGPVNACGVCLETSSIEGAKQCFELLTTMKVTDSKKLTTKKRELIFSTLGLKVDELEKETIYTPIKEQNFSLHFFIAEKSHNYIDRHNILFASLKCMEDASLMLSKGQRARVLIDGNKTFENHQHLEQETIVKGDSKSLLIGLASIIAKEYRDYLMQKWGEKFPGYGLEKHAGYPTPTHKKAVATLGPTPIHRRSFKGVKEFC